MLVDQPASEREDLARFLAKPEGKASKKKYDLTLATGALMIVVAVNLLAVALLLNWPIVTLTLPAGILLPAGVATILFARSTWSADKTAFRAGQDGQAERDTSRRGRILKDPELENLILLNRQQIEIYHRITTRQARRADRNSQAAMAVGFAILTVGALTVLRVADDTSKVVVGVLASLGSLFSGYISHTFLRAESVAMAQLNFYFRQPLVTSYILLAERVSQKLPREQEPQALRALIDRVLDAAIAGVGNPGSGQTSRKGRKSRAKKSAKLAQMQPMRQDAVIPQQGQDVRLGPPTSG